MAALSVKDALIIVERLFWQKRCFTVVTGAQNHADSSPPPHTDTHTSAAAVRRMLIQRQEEVWLRSEIDFRDGGGRGGRGRGRKKSLLSRETLAKAFFIFGLF